MLSLESIVEPWLRLPHLIHGATPSSTGSPLCSDWILAPRLVEAETSLVVAADGLLHGFYGAMKRTVASRAAGHAFHVKHRVGHGSLTSLRVRPPFGRHLFHVKHANGRPQAPRCADDQRGLLPPMGCGSFSASCRHRFFQVLNVLVPSRGGWKWIKHWCLQVACGMLPRPHKAHRKRGKRERRQKVLRPRTRSSRGPGWQRTRQAEAAAMSGISSWAWLDS
jgi:hypothetical protein